MRQGRFDGLFDIARSS